MRLLMSGSSGFVGVSLSEYLRRRGYEVVPYQRSQEPPTGSFDAIIHLAARVHQMTESADSAEVERLFKESNVDLTDHLLRLAEERKIKRFIFFSSVKAVGEENDQVYVPTSPLRPQDAYGRSKAAAESLVENWARQNKAEFLILRCPLIYGQGVRANFARLIQFT
ncbi:MAG: NAD-dependent epimerase/dehydratase family protein, partial [Proteobacteria bacterium]